LTKGKEGARTQRLVRYRDLNPRRGNIKPKSWEKRRKVKCPTIYLLGRRGEEGEGKVVASIYFYPFRPNIIKKRGKTEKEKEGGKMNIPAGALP